MTFVFLILILLLRESVTATITDLHNGNRFGNTFLNGIRMTEMY